VNTLANLLGNMANVGRDQLDDAARALAAELTRLLRWSRNAPAPPPTLGTLRSEDGGTEPPPVGFNPFHFPLR
jgi:hypothetical protein